MASRGINKVILIGNLGQDPEVKFFPSGGSVANTTLATSESWKDKQTGEQKEKTEWHRIVFSNRLAEIAGEYLKKGSKVYIEGKLSTRKWQNQQGVDQYTTEVKVFEMQMLGGNDGGQQNGGQNQGSQNQGGGYQQNQPAPQAQPQSQPQNQGGYQPNAAPNGYGQPSTQSSYQNQNQASHSGQSQNQPHDQSTNGQQQSSGQNWRNNQPANNPGQQAPGANPQEPVMDFSEDIPF